MFLKHNQDHKYHGLDTQSSNVQGSIPPFAWNTIPVLSFKVWIVLAVRDNSKDVILLPVFPEALGMEKKDRRRERTVLWIQVMLLRKSHQWLLSTCILNKRACIYTCGNMGNCATKSLGNSGWVLHSPKNQCHETTSYTNDIEPLKRWGEEGSQWDFRNLG